ncbi:crossover junction endodeoxyribonuclease RusA [Peptostreptococcaceae bacterium oral taxon 113 str. W5053]|nr:crossover junction endodeoxyribonuclease RusA [Peptostreptococcaceae bacterium oral taxon 113 str. W5053]
MFVEFFMVMIPPTVTYQEKRVNFKAKTFYEHEKLKTARQKLTDNLWKYRPNRKLRGPLRLCVKWCYPLRNSKFDGQYKDTKPDLDNAQKLLQDCMTDVGFWVDDSQIASLICEKFWAKIPGIYIRVEKI